MKTGLIIGVGAVAVVAIAAASYMIDVEQTEDAQLPNVEIDVEGGQLPEYETTVGDVDIVDETMTVDVPEVEVTTREEEVTVPMLDVQPPGEDSRAAESREARENAPAQAVQ
ncbi:hypothetical protein Dshi_2204 [Dinoroseobacter shibae DFL 12 = DSM 16493]|jgi:hypothetical protein|uniref:Uncharacterized protein n=1 Tax=Dinoroseobacter shibae (strain DSM 16493 / NCIMB 14021 / DFL 12) TaxID=398580 RepID=A8LR17_DINSH|nr:MULTISPECIES: hypothetical protein [Dinoroseobacter]ABV93940.1 hypothetical protein Dshi_2204 [Dinoroseobacter shibae DFL 12 = DSM 16493]MDD9716545.1 hypothetical protein [Dinoroseobacter sp. PD6]URF45385.1 hypothetical protein M8008_11380 [Dinoroseobacter shibae]URF49690.1 hypothetical protein M8007_11380 [Dinoroseobacter shibae]